MNILPQLNPRTLVPLVLLLAVAGGTHAMTPEPGFPVKKIPFADQIDDWHVVDARHLVRSSLVRLIGRE